MLGREESVAASSPQLIVHSEAIRAKEIIMRRSGKLITDRKLLFNPSDHCSYWARDGGGALKNTSRGEAGWEHVAQDQVEARLGLPRSSTRN